MRIHHRRQSGDSSASQIAGSVTRQPTPSGSSLAVDTSHTASVSGIVLPSLTVTTSSTPSSSPASSTPAPQSSSSHSSISTGAIIGITVGIFLAAALVLVIFMSIRHKKRIQAMRARRKSWARIKDDKTQPQMQPQPPSAPVQMRATAHAQNASISDPNTRPGDESFLSLNSTHALILQSQLQAHQDQLQANQDQQHQHQATQQQPAPPSRNPFLTQPPARSPSPLSRGTDDSHIPNPFSSPPRSPSHSPTPSGSTYSSQTHTHVALYHAASDYPYEFPLAREEQGNEVSHFPEPPNEVSRFSEDITPTAPNPPQPARLVRKPSAKATDAKARERELKAMQDLISALDDRAHTAKPPPSAYHALKVDTRTANTNRGTSRLSMGEGLVTPGGHSIRDDDEEGQSGIAYEEGHGSFPLPPAEVFRAALNMGKE